MVRLFQYHGLKIFVWLFLILLVAVTSGWAQNSNEEETAGETDAEPAAEASESSDEEASDQESRFQFGIGLGLGTQSFDEAGSTVVYQSASLYPTFGYGRLSLGLDLTLNYTFTGGGGNEFDVREEGWVPDDDQNIAEVYLPKIRFLQWAEEGAPLFAKVGSLDNVTLGNGYIMGGYTNTQFLPDRRILGARLDVDGRAFQFPYLGMETMVANLAAFELFGGRLYTRPLAAIDAPVISDLQIGSTLVADIAPDYHIDKLENDELTAVAQAYDDPDEVAVWGADVRLPILAEPPFTLTTFSDYVRQRDNQGAMVGTGGRIARIVTYGGQIRYNGENFIPNYFDAPYDLYRLEKYAVYDSDESLVEEHFGWLASTGVSLFEELLELEVSMEGPFGSGTNAENQLTGFFRLGQGLVPSFSLEAQYRKVGINSFEDIGDPNNSVIDARVTYHAEATAISLVYNLRYNPSTDDYVITSGLQSEITLR